MPMQSGRTLSSRWLRNVFSLERSTASNRVPLFLCPALQSVTGSNANRLFRRPNSRLVHTGKLHAESASQVESEPAYGKPAETTTKTLPLLCSGCGALSQTTVPGRPGYFDLQRKSVRSYLGTLEVRDGTRVERTTDVVKKALRDVNLEEMEALGVNLKTLLPERAPAVDSSKDTPLCDRCHHLLHQNSGAPIFHPSIESLRDTIFESPYKYNYVYHVLDAADFPMSLVPRIDQILETAPLRSHNRRTRSEKYYANKSTKLDFVITRSDLLAPTKEQVDRLMPYLRETLRDALGRTARDVRLGNVHCVSSQRGWWTKELRDEIFERGGAGWLVGKANVGKSRLFKEVFPKGRGAGLEPSKHDITVDLELSEKLEKCGVLEPPNVEDAELSLLPPVPPETMYPAMPLVSSLPGTTASPIRLSFGGGKGELIDLPGLPRSDLESYVQEKERGSLIMKKRISPEQIVLTPGKSLLLGGFIRITPRTPDLDVLLYNFTPLKEHATSTEKAIGIQERVDPVNVENISTPEASENIKLAASVELRYDVTKQRAGPLTRKNSVDLKVEQLPFRVLSADILIEGCGWVEVVAQVRARNLPLSEGKGGGEEHPEILSSLDLSAPDPQPQSEFTWPVIDVFTPEGRFVSSRRPMNGWLINKHKPPQGKQKRPHWVGRRR
ncbi:hypothetical protein QBC47DRAFT_384381 [Echria macrotheca]|uniref:Genetic interactor of prohibitins 3, mitochondrial n=1 Tax=Echria macrotheca TaxID=438768 RepID=A0AAJ0FAT3_9PEZI|nr:hypothetical protein QBC47DRAFT_384381 [Echria macrotheca]